MLDTTPDSPTYTVVQPPSGYREFVEERKRLWDKIYMTGDYNKNEWNAARNVNKKRCMDRSTSLTSMSADRACDREAEAALAAARKPGEGGTKSKKEFYENPEIQ